MHWGAQAEIYGVRDEVRRLVKWQRVRWLSRRISHWCFGTPRNDGIVLEVTVGIAKYREKRRSGSLRRQYVTLLVQLHAMR